MTPLTADQELALRVWVGDDPTLEYLQSIYDLTESLNETVVYVLNRKIALASEEPASLSVPGLSISWGNQLQNLQQLLKSFLATPGLDEGYNLGAFTVGQLTRPSTR